MGKDSSVDDRGEKVPTDDLVNDQKAANPAHQLPVANRASDTVAGNVELDAELEDRFEATDN